MRMSEIYENEMIKRIELIEFHLLNIIRNDGGKTIDHHASSALLILNPKNPTNNIEWINNRIVELFHKYYDETGRLVLLCSVLYASMSVSKLKFTLNN